MESREKLVWYLSYGSNLSLERFLFYIFGKKEKGKKDYINPIPKPFRYFPKDSRRVIFKGKLILNSWAYVDLSGSELCYGRMYLVTQEQFKAIEMQERYEGKTVGFYQGIEIKTVTRDKAHKEVYEDYRNLLLNTLKTLFKDTVSQKYLEFINKTPICGNQGKYDNIDINELDLSNEELEKVKKQIKELHEITMKEEIVELSIS